MKYFEKITKKEFITALTTKGGAMISAGFTKKSLTNEEFEAQIVEISKDTELNKDNICKFTTQSNALIRHTPEGEKSYLYFDGKDEIRNFYKYENIYIKESLFNDYDKQNYIIYKTL